MAGSDSPRGSRAASSSSSAGGARRHNRPERGGAGCGGKARGVRGGLRSMATTQCLGSEPMPRSSAWRAWVDWNEGPVGAADEAWRLATRTLRPCSGVGSGAVDDLEIPAPPSSAAPRAGVPQPVTDMRDPALATSCRSSRHEDSIPPAGRRDAPSTRGACLAGRAARRVRSRLGSADPRGKRDPRTEAGRMQSQVSTPRGTRGDVSSRTTPPPPRSGFAPATSGSRRWARSRCARRPRRCWHGGRFTRRAVTRRQRRSAR